MSSQAMEFKKAPTGKNQGSWLRRAARRMKNEWNTNTDSTIPERGGNWIVETGEVSAPEARFTNSMADSKELQRRLGEYGGIAVAAASWKDLSEDRVQRLVADLEKSPEELIASELKARGLQATD